MIVLTPLNDAIHTWRAEHEQFQETPIDNKVIIDVSELLLFEVDYRHQVSFDS